MVRPYRRYQIFLKSAKGPIDMFLVQQQLRQQREGEELVSRGTTSVPKTIKPAALDGVLPGTTTFLLFAECGWIGIGCFLM